MTRHHRRVRWRVRRCPDGWLPIVLIGEEPITLGCQPEKYMAREVARTYASSMRNASNGY